MKLGESVEDCSTRYLQLRHKIPKQFVDLNFMSQELKHLVHVSRYSEPLDFPSSSTLDDHEAPQFIEEDPKTLFIPFPPAFLVSKRVPHRSGHKAKKSA